mgnify:CR=1 FL=1
MRWLKESNEEAEGDECCGWRRRLRRINKTLNATLEDGTTVSKSIQLQVINSSNKEDDKVTEKPSDNNQITNKPSNKPSNNEIANGNANKNDSIKLENSSNNKLPNTGAAVSSGLIGSLSTLIGAVLLRKKK